MKELHNAVVIHTQCVMNQSTTTITTEKASNEIRINLAHSHHDSDLYESRLAFVLQDERFDVRRPDDPRTNCTRTFCRLAFVLQDERFDVRRPDDPCECSMCDLIQYHKNKRGAKEHHEDTMLLLLLLLLYTVPARNVIAFVILLQCCAILTSSGAFVCSTRTRTRTRSPTTNKRGRSYPSFFFFFLFSTNKEVACTWKRTVLSQHRFSSVSTDNQERDLASLQTWADQVGITHHHDALNLLPTVVVDGNEDKDDNDKDSDDNDDKSGCWGVTVSTATPKDTIVLQVPAYLVLSSTKIQQTFDQQHASKFQNAIDFLKQSKYQNQLPQFYLFLQILLLKHAKQEQSLQYSSWLQSLPRQFDTSVTMDNVELSCLPPYAWALANVERAHLQAFRQALQQLLPQELELIFATHMHNDDDDGDDEKNRLTEWVFNVVFTRCWSYPKQKSQKKKKKNDDDDDADIYDEVSSSNSTHVERCDIVPFADLFNHGEMNIHLDYDENDNVIVSTACDVQAGDALFLSYGKCSNPYRFLVVYGFVDEKQPEIMAQINVADPTQRHVDLGYDLDKMVFRTQDGAIATAVWDVVLYSILTQVPDIQEAFYQAHMKGDIPTKTAIHDRFLLETCITLRKHVDGTVNEMKELHDKIMSHDESKHPRLSLIRKNNAFVQRTFEKVKSRIDEMIQSEMVRRTELSNIRQQHDGESPS